MYISKLNSGKLALLIVFLAAISYINSLSVYFIWDDYPAVISNANIRSLSPGTVFKPLYEDIGSHVAKAPAYYRPLQVLSYALDYRIWKLNPFGYHLTNIILHIADAILLYALLLLLFRDSLFAFLGAALFGTNPVFTSSVTYISGRADILALFFTLGMLITFIKSIKDGSLNIFFYGLSLFCFFLLLLSKEIGAAGILFLIMLDKLISGAPRTKVQGSLPEANNISQIPIHGQKTEDFAEGIQYSDRIKRNLIYLPFVLALVLWLFLKPSAAPGFHAASAGFPGMLPGFLTLLKGMAVYTFLSMVPFHLRMGRSITVIAGPQDIWAYISIASLIIAIVLCIIGARKDRLIIFGLFWFYIPLFILFFFDFLFARRGNEILLPEHYLYFCYAGFLIFLLSIITPLRLKTNIRKYLAGIFVFLAVLYAGLTISENFVWQDEIRFFETNIRYNKDSAFNFMPYASLGSAYERAKRFGQAEESFKSAAERSKGNPLFYNMLASFYMRRGDFDTALKTLAVSEQLDGSFYATYLLSGICHVEKGEKTEALNNFEKALLLNPADQLSRKYLEALKK